MEEFDHLKLRVDQYVTTTQDASYAEELLRESKLVEVPSLETYFHPEVSDDQVVNGISPSLIKYLTLSEKDRINVARFKDKLKQINSATEDLF